MNAGCAGKTVRSLSALEACSRQGAIQIHVYLPSTLPMVHTKNKHDYQHMSDLTKF